MARILIVGGHGKVALLLAPQLVARGDTVTSVIRNPAHDAEVAATGAAPLVADVAQLDTDQLTNIVAGNDVVVWSAGAGGGDPQRTYAVDRDAAIRSMDAAAVAQVSVARIAEGTFDAEATVSTSGGAQVVAARPSEATALASRAAVPILVADEVMMDAGVPDFLPEEDVSERLDEFKR
ncbi:MAG: bifunctional nuclease domain-containing protein, partial [Microbacterium sp.]|uniref:bifunctional nuclease domain-containing protein n=1 Tax=Microbacterium sp. TaxID=51671 RepID=UPI003A8C27FE